MERRLSAVFAADMVEYSRLMEADEIGTLERQKAHRKELIDPAFEEYHGRIVKEMGDGILVEFPSVVEAVQCAVAIQRAMPEREADVPDERKITYRMGINLGDIVVEEDDIYGSGVNVAARLEAMAEPGGICLSGTAYDHLGSTVEVGYEALGEVAVKNIERPIRAYKVLTDPERAGAVVEKQRRRINPRHWGAIALALLLIAGAGGWWWSQQPDFEPADLDNYALALPDTPSIAVLPFDNLSGDASQEYIADGLTENIITTLAYSPELLVIARNSTFTYKGKPVKVQQVAEELGVRYVLEGSLQKAGDQIRVTAQLIDALDGKHLWAERFDRDLTTNNLLKLQDEITRKILTEINVKIAFGERARGWDSMISDLEDYRLMVQFRAELFRFSDESMAKAEAIAREAYEKNPDGAFGNYLVGTAARVRLTHGFSKNIEEDYQLGIHHIGKAAEILPDDATVMAVAAGMTLLSRNYDEAIAQIERAIELNPSDSIVLGIGASIHYWSGDPARSLELLRKMMRANPNYEIWVRAVEAGALARLGRYEEAEAVYNAILDIEDPEDARVRGWALAGLAAVKVWQGDLEAARRIKDVALTEYPNASLEDIDREQFLEKDRAWVEKFRAALREAGVPEHPPLKPPEKPSIAVLPFDNLSDDEAQQYFVDGLVEDLITDLSKVPSLFVIARNSSFAYRDKAVDVKRIARELGVKHVLEGSVRRAGDRVRINAQLIDGQTNIHLWADRYDGTMDDVFGLQDTITAEIVAALSLKLSTGNQNASGSSRTNNPEAYDLFLKGREQMRLVTREGYARARQLFQQAIQIDADYSDAHAWLAYLYWDGRNRFWYDALEVANAEVALDRARQHLETAFLHPTPIAFITKAYLVATIEMKIDEAAELSRQAVEMDPNFAEGHVRHAVRLAFVGETDLAFQHLAKARRLDPQLPPNFHFSQGLAHYVAGDYEKARNSIEQAIEHNSEDTFSRILLAAVYGHTDAQGPARRLLDAIQQNRSKVGAAKFMAGDAYWWPFKHLKDRARLYDDLVLAGAPQHKIFADNKWLERELSPNEAEALLIPSVHSGVMVTPSGSKFPYTAIHHPDYTLDMDIRIIGEVHVNRFVFDANGIRNEWGPLQYFELSDAGKTEWNQDYAVFQEISGDYYYFSIVSSGEDAAENQ